MHIHIYFFFVAALQFLSLAEFDGESRPGCAWEYSIISTITTNFSVH
jgi:hypothetical protein